MSFCDHCEGQRFDRARVLRLLRAAHKTIRKGTGGEKVLGGLIKAVRAMDIPHLERLDESVDGEIIH